MLYGFNREDAAGLKRMVRKEGLRSKNRAKVKYPQPLPDDFYFRLCKPNQNIAKGVTDTVTIYNASTGTSTGEEIEAIARATAVVSAKYCSLINVNGVFVVLPCEC
jgi:hypothetical protein